MFTQLNHSGAPRKKFFFIHFLILIGPFARSLNIRRARKEKNTRQMKFDVARNGLFRNGELTFQKFLSRKMKKSTPNSEVCKCIHRERRNIKQL